MEQSGTVLGDWRKARRQDGIEIAFQLTEGRGPAHFLLIHSLAMDGTFWDRLVPFLADHGDVLVFDCRGHGRSSKPAGPYSVQLFAEDAAAMLDEVGWNSAIVAGASMGGCVSIAFADAFRNRVDGLGLIDTTAWYGAEAQANWEQRGQQGVREGLASLVEFQKSRWLSDSFRQANPDIVDQAVAVFVANDSAAYLETCRMLGRCDQRAALPGFTCPTEIIVGSEDYATPLSMATELKSAIPGARLNVLEGARHFTPLERPDELGDILVRLKKN
jgi:3-oxoadipate enol-lactonase